MSIRITNAREVFFNNSKEQYLDFIKAWKEKAQKKESLSPLAHLVYSLLRGKPSTNGFSDITNPAKLEGKDDPKQALLRAATLYGHSNIEIADNIARIFDCKISGSALVPLMVLIRSTYWEDLVSNEVKEIKA